MRINIYYLLYLRDSYLLLPDSLKKLAINFNVQYKELYPLFFVNTPEIKLNSKGIVPEYKYFNEISIEEYNKYCINLKENFNWISIDESNNYCTNLEDTNNWDLIKETIKYCIQDCISLYQVIKEFSKKNI
jgi:DNA polymerase type B, organellar and viral